MIRYMMRTMNAFNGKAALFYDTWYERPKNKRLVEQEHGALLEMMKPQNDETLLEVGCGTGVFSHYFRQKGLRVVGVDISEDMLTVARTKGVAVRFIQGDAQHLPFEDSAFDITTAITTLEFTQKPDQVLQELYRVCNRVIVLGVLNKWSWLGLKRKLRKGGFFSRATFYSVKVLKKLVESNLGKVEIRMKLPFRAFIVASIKKK